MKSSPLPQINTNKKETVLRIARKLIKNIALKDKSIHTNRSEILTRITPMMGNDSNLVPHIKQDLYKIIDEEIKLFNK